MLSDDVLYEQIGVELESNNVDKAVWTRAFAMCNGDEQTTKVNYINLRFQKLKAESIEHSESEKRKSDQQRKDNLIKEKETQRLALMVSSKSGLEKILAIDRIKQKIDSGEVESLSQTPKAIQIQSSVRRGNKQEFSDFILENPLLVAVFNDYGDTLLHIAANEKHHSLAKLIIQAGGMADQTNDLGLSARQTLKKQKMNDALEALGEIDKIRIEYFLKGENVKPLQGPNLPVFGVPIYSTGRSTGTDDKLNEPIWVFPTGHGDLVTPVEDLVKEGKVEKSVLDALHQIAK